MTLSESYYWPWQNGRPRLPVPKLRCQKRTVGGWRAVHPTHCYTTIMEKSCMRPCGRVGLPDTRMCTASDSSQNPNIFWGPPERGGGHGPFAPSPPPGSTTACVAIFYCFLHARVFVYFLKQFWDIHKVKFRFRCTCNNVPDCFRGFADSKHCM